MDKELIKQDINFLEYPLWFQNRDAAHREEGFVWQDRDGYVYRAGYKPPVQIDFIFLFALLLRSQQENWQEEIVLTRYELLKASGLKNSRNSYWYQRLEESLERWKMVGIKFQGTFYDGKKYITMNFGIIDSWELSEESKELKIRFSPHWLLCVRNSSYFKMIDFGQIKALHSSLATRLYEILVKTFQRREKWEIDAVKLAAKIPMKEEHPAHIIPKIKVAVNRINECTELQLELGVRRPKRGKAIFEFRKLSTEQMESKDSVSPKVLDVPEEKQGELGELLQLVPEKERGKKTVLEMISKALRKHDEAYVRRNILYSNKQSTKSYRGYLSKALKEDWAGQAEEEARKEIEEQEELTSEAPPVRREPSEEEVEAKFQERLGELDEGDVSVRMSQARVEVAKEEKSHPTKVTHKAAQGKLFEILREEVRMNLFYSVSE